MFHCLGEGHHFHVSLYTNKTTGYHVHKQLLPPLNYIHLVQVTKVVDDRCQSIIIFYNHNCLANVIALTKVVLFVEEVEEMNVPRRF